jgi:hypothetical protein
MHQIALQKIDIKSAYRQCHLNAITAMQTITQLLDDKLGIIMLRLTFGGAPCPFEWNIISESDLANEILFDQATIVIEGMGNAIRCERATLLAIDTCARPKHANEPIPREDMEARNKLHAEAGLEEQKTVLGWLIDTRRLLVKLPDNKFVAWTNIIKEVMRNGTTTAKELESIIG